MPARLTVNLQALRANYRLLKNHHAKHHIAAVVKANAYGLGVKSVSEALWDEKCRFYFVATLEEAVELRGYLPDATIAVFNGLNENEAKIFVEHNVLPVINHPVQLAWLLPNMPYVLHVDTGMTRLGFSYSELQYHAATIIASGKCQLLLSHLACASTPAHPKNAEQLSRLQEAQALLPDIPISFANSSGHFLPTDFHFDMGRPGCALYGINPTEGQNPMQHVATLSAPILQIRELDRDEQVGYGSTFDAKKGSRIAIVALGYSDGYFRSQSNLGHAIIEGHIAPIAGRVSMDMIALDVSNMPSISAHARAEFINAQLPVDVIAEQCNTIGYEVFTRIGRRVERIYN